MGIKIFSDDSSSRTERRGIIHFSDSPEEPCISSYGTVDGQEKLEIQAPNRDGNPNKYRFKVVRFQQVGRKAVVVLLNYPDCYNYSGNKICVYDDASKWLKLRQDKCIDPHFLEASYSPVARFEPTERGWKLALQFAKLL